VQVPFPTVRHAEIAQAALEVDVSQAGPRSSTTKSYSLEGSTLHMYVFVSSACCKASSRSFRFPAFIDFVLTVCWKLFARQIDADH
jgi:hypothetical protein